jgi:threonine/homoserine/homoserine lactone efflux protein
MPPTTELLAFALAALVLLLSPGPAVLFVVAQSLQGGRLAGLACTLGLSLGGLVHVLAAVLGLSAVLASSAELFTAVKLVGAAYLVWLGIRTLRTPASEPGALAARPRRASRLFLDGLVVNVFNPKPALFFLAFLPQFVDPGRGGVTSQLLVLGLVFVGLGLLTDALYALVAARARGWLVARPQIWRGQRWVTGSIYLGLGATAAVAGHDVD